MVRPAVVLFMLMPSISLYTCEGTSAPVITDVEFPETMPGDGSQVDGTVYFEDADAGVYKAVLENVVCPVDGTCTGGVTYLADIDPDLPYATSGSFPFYLYCDNGYGEDFYWEWQWTLFDFDGNASEPYAFGTVCTSP